MRVIFHGQRKTEVMYLRFSVIVLSKDGIAFIRPFKKSSF